MTVMDISGDATKYSKCEMKLQSLQQPSAKLVLVITGRNQSTSFERPCVVPSVESAIKTIGDVAKVQEVALELYSTAIFYCCCSKRCVDEYEQRFLLSYNLRV